MERLHKTMRAEFFRPHERKFTSIADLQAALDCWVVHYNTERPHQALGMQPPVDRFRLAQKVLPAAAVDDAVGQGDPPPRPAVKQRSVQLSADGQVIRVHAARHDPAKEHGAFATPNGRPRKPKTLSQTDHVAQLPNSARRTGTGT